MAFMNGTAFDNESRVAVSERGRPVKGREMEGPMARWYARNRGTAAQMAEYRAQAPRVTGAVPDGGRVLEVAPGPGYLAVEMARLDRFAVSGLDISHTMVEIASDYARREGVVVDFREGDSADMPFESGSFDLIVCQAAFKNFKRPITALNEMHRVLRGGGVAVIQDMRREATGADIDEEVRRSQMGGLNAFVTKRILRVLGRRAYSRERFASVAAESEFRGCEIEASGIGIEVRLTKPSA
jgi:ubiquinone/menaquinone biosynthesis C-methylase UbiE